MPPQYTPLYNINGNRQGRGPDLGPYKRGEIAGMYQCSKTPMEIKVELGYLQGAIQHTLVTLQVRDKGTPLLKSSTPI